MTPQTMNNSMNARDIDLVDYLLTHNSENSCVEYKLNNHNPDMVGKLCSALANSATLAQTDTAYIIWGVDDKTLQIQGTSFDPSTTKKSNEVFEFWLTKSLTPNVVLEFRIISHPEGRLVILEIPAATTQPIAYKNIPYIRIGSATPKLQDYPAYFEKLIQNIQPFTWEKGIAKKYLSTDEVIALLNYPVYFKLLKKDLPENKLGILEILESEQLITPDVGNNWNITNLGAILLANDLTEFNTSIERKGIRFIAYDGVTKACKVTHRHNGRKGYISAFQGLITYINNLLPINEHIGTAFRAEQKIYPEIAIRELIANALIHQDMTISGAGPQVEMFSDRIEITNPGNSLVQINRIIDFPPRSRNEALASIMRRMGLCEEQGSGIDKVIISVELFQLPAPNFSEKGNFMQVILYSPRPFAKMSVKERIRACYQHAVIKSLSGEKMKNQSLCKRFGIDKKNAAQVSKVLKAALEHDLIKPAELENVRSGYVPNWN